MSHDPMPLPAPDPDGLPRATERFLRAAAEEADVVYAELDSPLGPLVAAATPRGLARLAYRDFDGGLDGVLTSLATRVSPRIVAAPGRLDDVRRQLDEFFAGRRQTFNLPVDLRLCATFGRRVLEETARIPFGSTSTYGAIARALGTPGASRATGNALGANPVPIVIPCHRVLRTGGGLGGYTGGLHRKERLLGLEGVVLA